MSEHLGTAKTVGELIQLLSLYDPDFPVRVFTGTRAYDVEVREHQRCLTLEA